MGTNHRSDI